MVEISQDGKSIKVNDVWMELPVNYKIYLDQKCRSCQSLGDCILEGERPERILFCTVFDKVKKIPIAEY